MSEKIIATIAVAAVIIYALFNYKSKNIHRNIEANKTISHLKYKSELEYIIDVINNGSNRLHFKGSPMEGGYISKDSAKDVACYLYELRGNKCKEKYNKQEASMLFSSNCTGCHGINAKGIGKSYPSLLRKPFLGLEKNY